MTHELRKSYFFSDAIDYLGHVTTLGRRRVAAKTKGTITTLNHPTHMTELKTFFGLFQFVSSLRVELRQESWALEQTVKEGEIKRKLTWVKKKKPQCAC